jgi:hypothetical protein
LLWTEPGGWLHGDKAELRASLRKGGERGHVNSYVRDRVIDAYLNREVEDEELDNHPSLQKGFGFGPVPDEEDEPPFTYDDFAFDDERPESRRAWDGDIKHVSGSGLIEFESDEDPGTAEDDEDQADREDFEQSDGDDEEDD